MKPATILFFCLLLTLQQVPAVHASDFSEILGVNHSIDKAAADMQLLLNQARESASALELQANRDGKERIKDIDNLVKSAIDDIKKVEDKSKRDIDNILSKYTDEFKRPVSAII